MIEVSNLHKTFRKRKGLFGLSFSIAAGEAVGLLGGQESGKTVLMDVLSGCSVPSSGEVLVDGYDATDESDAIRRIVGYMPNPLPLYPDMTVEEYLDFIYAIKRVRGKNHFSHIIELCRKTGIENLFGRMIKGLTLAAQKRVALAQALIGDPNILLIDDPEDGLDAEDALALRNLIADISISRTVLVSAQEQESLAGYSRLLILDDPSEDPNADWQEGEDQESTIEPETAQGGQIDSLREEGG